MHAALRVFMLRVCCTVLSLSIATPLWSQVYDVHQDYNDNLLLALADARTAPGVIYLTRGTYTLPPNALIIDTPGITIRGDGPGATTLLITGNGDGITFLVPPPVPPQTISPADNCGGIEDLTIKGGVGRTSGRNIVITRCRDGHIENVTIDSPGHGIVFSCPVDNAGCGRWKSITNAQINLTGPSAGIIIDGGNDRFFHGVHIRGDRAPGSRGILIKQSKGADDFDTIDIVLTEVGVAIIPDAGKSVEFIHFDKVYADTGSVYGWNFAGQGNISGVTCNTCWASANGKTIEGYGTGAGLSSRGIRITNGDMISFSDAQVFNNDGIGVEISGTSRNIQFNGGWISANGILSPGTLPGIYLNNGSGGVQLTGTRIGNAVYSPVTQSCGAEIAPGTSNVTMTGLDLRGNAEGVCQ